MQIIRDDKRIARMKKISQYVSLLGLLALVSGLLVLFVGTQNALLFQLIALGVGWILSQVGVYLSHRYGRSPRPDEVLDEALRPAIRDGRIYHYILPAAHVLLVPNGIIIIVAKYQTGKISAEGDKWKQTGIGMRRFFGQEGIGNPTKEAESQVSAIANFLRKNAPEIEEVPIAPLIVFTTKKIDSLEVANSRIPAMHYTKLKGFLRTKKDVLPPLPGFEYDAIRAAFDQKAGVLAEVGHGDPA